jgi:hypothetical protein
MKIARKRDQRIAEVQGKTATYVAAIDAEIQRLIDELHSRFKHVPFDEFSQTSDQPHVRPPAPPFLPGQHPPIPKLVLLAKTAMVSDRGVCQGCGQEMFLADTHPVVTMDNCPDKCRYHCECFARSIFQQEVQCPHGSPFFRRA